MPENEILEEIYRVRAEIARAGGFEVKNILARAKEQVGDLEAQGWKTATFPPRPLENPGVVREDPLAE